MKKMTFLRVLKSNLKCAFCKKKNCSVRYYPERKFVQYCEGSIYVTICEKDKNSREDKILKKQLP